MRHAIIAVIATTLTSAGWAAESQESYKFENIGFGSGAVLGAASGNAGSGAVIGTAVGGLGGAATQGLGADEQYKRAYIKCLEGRGQRVLN